MSEQVEKYHTDSVREALNLIQEVERSRVSSCARAISDALDKHQCTLKANAVLKDGRITAETSIEAVNSK